MALCGMEAEQGAVAVLVREHTDLADRVVGTMASAGIPRHVSRDDLRSAALLALFQAANRFDRSIGVPFELYAARRMRGAVLDELRSCDWATRTTRQRVRQVDQAIERLSHRLGRTPHLDEVADELGLPVEEVTTSHGDHTRASVLQLEALYADHDGDLPIRCDAPGPDVIVLEQARDEALDAAVDELPPRLGTVIRGYYLHGRKLRDLADELGVTESRVCQMRGEGVKALREVLAGADL